MAYEVIDLISSSPGEPTACPEPRAAQRHPPRDDDIEDEADGLRTEARPNKRLRLSPAPEQPATTTSVATRKASPSIDTPSALPPFRNMARKASVIHDPIELTSSPNPFASSDLPDPLDRGHKPTARAPAASTTRVPPTKAPQIDSDPFASSPHIAPQAQRKALAPIINQSSDPFASSPVPTTTLQHPADSNRVNKTSARASTKRDRAFDPISSSAPEVLSFRSSPPAEENHKDKSGVISIDDSDEASQQSDDSLPGISDLDFSKPAYRRPRSPLRRSRSDIIPRTTKKTEADKERDKRDRAARAAAKEVEKEKKRLDREEAKREMARDKARAAALAEVNKVRTDKKVSTPEMIVDLPSGLRDTIRVQVQTLLGSLGVEHTTMEGSDDDNVIRWRRKVTSRYNEAMGYWEPIPLRVDAENHVLVILTADEFVGLALDDALEDHVSGIERRFRGNHIIYLLEGMTPWIRKNRNLRNRQFASRVRAQDPAAAPAASRRPRNAAAQEYVDEDCIEDALLQLQVMHDVLIHHTTVPLETARWITIFTQHISTIPYRRQRDKATLGAGFCMESGQVRTGDDVADTYIRMLQEISRVTAPIAHGIAAEFGSVTKLVNGLVEGGPLRLENVRKSANKDGAFSDRTVGQAVSRRMHKVFTGRDESSTDI
ncbi:hypothetical protein B0I35DRAFT_444022 [Stachybotrys elegans]|uniref:ERCC4 domain-containing protein n=1 Tax=Stachybotrys elegans TaxID=80388 RepID=A0A8K0SKG5_9HYPO|nr:hypothetical protein B0I35DRAFT_444022 [Stachybotrys elegans]